MSESTYGRQHAERVHTSDAYVEELEHRLQNVQRELRRVKEEHDEPDRRDRRGVGGTPNRSGTVAELLNRGTPPTTAFEEIPDGERTLHRTVAKGPGALTNEGTPVYPVHERTHTVLVNASSLAREQSRDGSALYLTVPTVKRFLESREDTRLKHTQIRRVFETIEDAGKAYPRPPVLHKNADGVVELVIFDYPRLFDRVLVA